MSASRHKIPESVLVVIHTAELEVLLIERVDRPGSWQSVTGSKDTLEESLVDTCLREVREETGICTGICIATRAVPLAALVDWQLANTYEIWHQWRHRYAPGVTTNTEHVFSLRVPRGTPVRLSPREHLAFEWLGVEAAAARCFSPTNAEAIRQLPRRAVCP